MKKIVAVLMAMVMVMSVTVALAGGTAAKDTQPENVVEYKKTLDIVMPEPVIETYGGYHVPRAHGYDFMTEPSVPMLPVKSFSLVIPQTAEIKSIKVVSSTKEELRGDYDIFPVQEPVPTSRDTTVRFTPKNPAIYASSNSYPGKLFEYAGEGNLRDYRILSIFVYPLQYNPAGKKLTFYKNINIEVTYTAPPSKSRETKQDEFALMVKALVSNPEDVDTLPTSTTEETSDILPTQNAEYVIITDSTFETEFQALADHKMSKGLSAEIVTVSWITNNYSGVDTQEKIRNFITDAKNTWNTKWVLLGGDTDIIPHRLAYSNFQGENEYIPADLYYSDLNGNWDADGDQIYGEVTDSIDFYPDVFVGRAPVDTIAEANTFVSKTIVYEGGPLGYEAKVLFLAEMLDSSTDGGIAKNIIDDNYIPDTFSVTKLYDSLGNLNKVNAMNELNAGYGIVNHIGHGGVSVIGIGPDALYNADMDSLTNSPKNSIFYSISCHSNTFEQNSFSEHFVLNPDGGGIAYIGNSRYGWYISGSPNGPSDLYDREFFKSLFNEGFYHVGETLADSKITFVPASQSGDTVQRWIQYALNLLGDPETQIWIFIQSEHDISIEIVAAPNYLEPNETTLINSTIRNLGLNNETNIEVDFLVNGTEVDKTIIPFIEHGTSVLVSFPWEAPSTEGMYNLTVYAVPVPEENVTVNNQDTRMVLVKIRGEILIVSDAIPK
jgi:archaellum component FlaF (FlaF/FlaG flagellin family)